MGDVKICSVCVMTTVYVVEFGYLLMLIICHCMCCSEFGGTHLQTVSLAGVADAHAQHSDAEPKGIKAYFRVDDGGLLYLDKVHEFLYLMCIAVSVLTVCHAVICINVSSRTEWIIFSVQPVLDSIK